MRIILIFIIIISFLIIQEAYSDTLIVNKTEGCKTGDAYFYTIRDAIGNATDFDTIYICGDYYPESIEIINKNNLRIIGISFKNKLPILNGEKNKCCLINIYNSSNITIRNIILRSNITTSWYSKINNSYNISLENLELYYIPGDIIVEKNEFIHVYNTELLSINNITMISDRNLTCMNISNSKNISVRSSILSDNFRGITIYNSSYISILNNNFLNIKHNILILNNISYFNLINNIIKNSNNILIYLSKNISFIMNNISNINSIRINSSENVSILDSDIESTEIYLNKTMGTITIRTSFVNTYINATTSNNFEIKKTLFLNSSIVITKSKNIYIDSATFNNVSLAAYFKNSSNINIRNSNFSETLVSIILNNSNIIIDNSNIQRNNFGIISYDSTLNVYKSNLNFNFLGIYTENSLLNISGSNISYNDVGVFLQEINNAYLERTKFFSNENDLIMNRSSGIYITGSRFNQTVLTVEGEIYGDLMIDSLDKYYPDDFYDPHIPLNFGIKIRNLSNSITKISFLINYDKKPPKGFKAMLYTGSNDQETYYFLSGYVNYNNIILPDISQGYLFYNDSKWYELKNVTIDERNQTISIEMNNRKLNGYENLPLGYVNIVTIDYTSPKIYLNATNNSIVSTFDLRNDFDQLNMNICDNKAFNVTVYYNDTIIYTNTSNAKCHNISIPIRYVNGTNIFRIIANDIANNTNITTLYINYYEEIMKRMDVEKNNTYRFNLAKELHIDFILKSNETKNNTYVYVKGKKISKQNTDTSSLSYSPNRIIVKFKDGYDIRVLNSLLSKTGIKNLRIAKKYKKFRNLYVLEFDGNVLLHKIIKTFRHQPFIEYVEPDYIVFKFKEPNDPRFNEQWGLRIINITKAWNLTTGSKYVYVAVIDSGIDYNHTDLKDNIWRNDLDCDYDYEDDDKNGYIDDCHGINAICYENGEFNATACDIPDAYDLDSHGTHVSGIIGAVGNNSVGITGINWRVNIIPCKFINVTYGRISDAIECLDYILMLKEDKNINIIATSNSWGSYFYSKALYDAIKRHEESGILFIAAAGNDQNDNDINPLYPASYNLSNIISVAALDKNLKLATFSNYGKHTVHIAAPGVDILSTVPNNDYKYYDGTSMATPFITGVAALLKSYNPSLTWYEVRNLILSSSYKLSNLQDKVITSGLVDAYSALTCINRTLIAILEPKFDTYNMINIRSIPLKAVAINCTKTYPVSVNIYYNNEFLKSLNLTSYNGYYIGSFEPVVSGFYTLEFISDIGKINKTIYVETEAQLLRKAYNFDINFSTKNLTIKIYYTKNDLDLDKDGIIDVDINTVFVVAKIGDRYFEIEPIRNKTPIIIDGREFLGYLEFTMKNKPEEIYLKAYRIYSKPNITIYEPMNNSNLSIFDENVLKFDVCDNLGLKSVNVFHNGNEILKEDVENVTCKNYEIFLNYKNGTNIIEIKASNILGISSELSLIVNVYKVHVEKRNVTYSHTYSLFVPMLDIILDFIPNETTYGLILINGTKNYTDFIEKTFKNVIKAYNISTNFSIKNYNVTICIRTNEISDISNKKFKIYNYYENVEKVAEKISENCFKTSFTKISPILLRYDVFVSKYPPTISPAPTGRDITYIDEEKILRGIENITNDVFIKLLKYKSFKYKRYAKIDTRYNAFLLSLYNKIYLIPYIRELSEFAPVIEREIENYHYFLYVNLLGRYIKNVIICREDLVVDSYVALLLSKQLRAPILPVLPDRVPKYILELIKELNPETIYIIGGEVAISKDVEARLSNYAKKIVRIAGETRIETSIEILKRLKNYKYVIISNWNPDIRLTYISYFYNIPIIYVKDKLKYEHLEILKELKQKGVTIIFSNVNESVKEEIYNIMK